MLVLTRKKQQSVHIGENITISVLKIKGNTVRLGIEAPNQIRVLRAEIPMFDGRDGDESQETTSPEAETHGSSGKFEISIPVEMEDDDGGFSARLSGCPPVVAGSYSRSGSNG